MWRGEVRLCVGRKGKGCVWEERGKWKDELFGDFWCVWKEVKQFLNYNDACKENLCGKRKIMCANRMSLYISHVEGLISRFRAVPPLKSLVYNTLNSP